MKHTTIYKFLLISISIIYSSRVSGMDKLGLFIGIAGTSGTISYIWARFARTRLPNQLYKVGAVAIPHTVAVALCVYCGRGLHSCCGNPVLIMMEFAFTVYVISATGSMYGHALGSNQLFTTQREFDEDFKLKAGSTVPRLKVYYF